MAVAGQRTSAARPPRQGLAERWMWPRLLPPRASPRPPPSQLSNPPLTPRIADAMSCSSTASARFDKRSQIRVPRSLHPRPSLTHSLGANTTTPSTVAFALQGQSLAGVSEPTTSMIHATRRYAACRTCTLAHELLALSSMHARSLASSTPTRMRGAPAIALCSLLSSPLSSRTYQGG